MEDSDSESVGARARHWLRAHVVALAVVLGAVLLYALVGFVVVPRVARSQMIQYVERDMHRHLSVGGIDFNPFTLTVQIRQLALSEADAAPIASFSLLRVRASAMGSLAHWAWTLSEVTLEQPAVHVLIRHDGSLNLAQLAPPEKPSAPPPKSSGKLPAVRIGTLAVRDGRVHFEDHSRDEPFSAALAPIEFSLSDFRTQPDFDNRYSFSAESSAHERFEWAGEFTVQPLGSDGRFAVGALKVATIAAYLGDALPFLLPSGSLDVDGSYHLVAAGQMNLNITLPSVKLHQLAIAPRAAAGADAAAATPWVTVPELDVSNTAVSLGERKVTIGEIALANPTLTVWRDKDGSLNLQQLMNSSAAPASASSAKPSPAATPAVAPATPTAPAAPTAPVWQIALARLNVSAATIDAEDRSVKPAAKLHLAPFGIDVRNYATDGAQPVSFELTTGIGQSGSLHSTGSVALSPLAADVALELKDFDLPTVQPYLAQQTAMTLYGGRLSVKGQVNYAAAPPAGQPQLKFAGGIDVGDLATRDNVMNADFVTWRALQIEGLRYQMSPDALEIARVRTTGAYARVIIEADGTMNVTQILKGAGGGATAPKPDTTASGDTSSAATPDGSGKVAVEAQARAPSGRAHPSTKPAAAKASAKASTGKPMPMKIARIDIEDGAANFSDHSIDPNFSTAILGLHGSVVGLSSDPSSRAQVTLAGNVDKYAPVSITGEVNLLAATTYTDIGLSFRNMELTTFNPYSGKFAGYSIAQGKLTTELHYHVENRQLNATHHVVIDQLEFGAATESKQAVPLPVKLAVALLKDRDGVITLDLPVGGSLDDPSFKIMPIVWKLLRGLVEKVVTAPFALLGSLFGGGPELQYVEFQPGSAALADSETQKLTKLIQALNARPTLRLDIPLHTSYAADDAALGRQALEQALTAASAPGAAKSKHSTSPGASPRLVALTALYRQKLGQDPQYPAELSAAPAAPPKTAAGASAPAPDLDGARMAWLEQQLLAQFAPTDDQRDALGRARADAVEGALLADKSLAPERVFLTDRASKGEAGGAVRLELKLQ